MQNFNKNVDSAQSVNNDDIDNTGIVENGKFFYPDWDEEVVIYDYSGQRYSYNHNHFVKVTETDSAEIYDVKTDRLLKIHNGRSWDIIDLIYLDDDEDIVDSVNNNTGSYIVHENGTVNDSGEYDNIYDEDDIVYVPVNREDY